MKKFNILFIFIIFIISMFNVYGVVDTTDLISYYSLDSDVNDDWGSYDLTEIGDGEISSTQSILGNSYSFDGTDKLTSSLYFTAQPFSISLWAYMGSYDNKYLLNTGGDSGGTKGFFVYLRNSGDIEFWINGGNQETFNTNLNTNTWYHLVFTWTGDSSANGLKLYVDSSLYNGDTSNTWTGDSTYGISYAHQSGGTTGYLDEIVIYQDRILTQSEVNELYNSGDGYNFLNIATPLTLDFLNYTPLNDTNLNTATSFYFNLSVDTNASCDLLVEGNNVDNSNYLTSGLNLLVAQSSDFIDGYNFIELNCTDNANTSHSIVQSKYIFYDDNNPIINYIDAVQISDNEQYSIDGSTIDQNFNLNVSCTDTNLFYLNYSFYPTSNPSDIRLNNISYTNMTNLIVSDTVNIGLLDEANMTLSVTCADGHTLNNIPNIPNWAIENGHQYDHILITTNSPAYDRFEYTKQNDKYNFTFYFNGYGTDISFFIGSTKKLYRKDNYLISGDYWIDFINYDGVVISGFHRINNNIVRIDMHSDIPTNKVSFHSIGLINKVTQEVIFLVDEDNDYVVLNSPKGRLFNITTSQNVLFNYTPFYEPTSPDNCSLYFNDTFKQIDYTISKNVNNAFTETLSLPPPQTYQYYSWFVRCENEIFHAPMTYETHIKVSNTSFFSVFNNNPTTTSTTSTTSTTTTTLMESGNGTIIYVAPVDIEPINTNIQRLILIVVWLFFLMACFSIKGQRGKTPQILSLFLIAWSIPLSINLFNISALYGLSVIGISVIVGISKMFE